MLQSDALDTRDNAAVVICLLLIMQFYLPPPNPTNNEPINQPTNQPINPVTTPWTNKQPRKQIANQPAQHHRCKYWCLCRAISFFIFGTMLCWTSSVIPWTLCLVFSILKLLRKIEKSRVGICIWTKNSISCDSPFVEAQWTSSSQDCQ